MYSYRPEVPPKSPYSQDDGDHFFNNNKNNNDNINNVRYSPISKEDRQFEHQQYVPYGTEVDYVPTPPPKDIITSNSNSSSQRNIIYSDESIELNKIPPNHYRHQQQQQQQQSAFNRSLPSLPPQPPFKDDDSVASYEHPDPFSNIFDDPSPKPLIEDKFKHHERQRIKLLRRKPRFHYTRLPYFTILVTIIQISVFIAELAKMSILTGSAFQTKPYFNPMLGPSTYLLINMGARYVPCMQKVAGITDDITISFPCANSTTVDTDVCSLNELCGMSGIPTDGSIFVPHQWYRVITPIFLHAGFLHIIFNLLLQVTMGATIERAIGVLKYAIIYLASGIAGFILGANYTPNGIASTGCSGSLFGIVATNMIMFAYCGTKNTNLYGTKKFGLFIFIMICEIVLSFVLGLLPGMDNFSHIGGFAMGILFAVALLPDPFFVYEDHIIAYDGSRSTWEQFCDNWNPFHNWEYKIPVRVYCWFGARIVALVLAGVYFGELITNFFTKDMNSTNSSCKWCKYINCIPVNGWCDLGNVSVETTSSGGSDNESATASSSTQPSSSTATPTQAATSNTLVTEIDNPTATSTPTSTVNLKMLKRSSNSIGQNEKLFDDFKNFNSYQEQYDSKTISSVKIPQMQVGLGLYIVVGIFTLRFIKAKKWI